MQAVSIGLWYKRRMKWTKKRTAYHVFCGMVMGAADIIPGVSGGTMALLLGIYARLIAAIDVLKKPFMGALLKGRIGAALKMLDWSLLLPLACGLLLAVALVVKVIGLPELLRTHPREVYGFFFGLIIGSIPLLLRGAKRPVWRWLWFVGGAILGYGITQLVPVSLPQGAFYVFLAGALAISAMLLPGISGSYILLILGQYAVVLEALEVLNLSILLPFVAGCAFGLLSFSKGLNWLMQRYGGQMIWLMAGLLLGTLAKIWPFGFYSEGFDVAVKDHWVIVVTLIGALTSGAFILIQKESRFGKAAFKLD